jgi:hypothetical protein
MNGRINRKEDKSGPKMRECVRGAFMSFSSSFLHGENAMAFRNSTIIFASTALLASALPTLAGDPVADLVLHVDIVNGAANGDGMSWQTANNDLQWALATAKDAINQNPFVDDVDIWVAQGTYLPGTATCNEPDCREFAFELINNVRLYGGFAGNETQRDERDWEENPTILSGDLEGDDIFTLTGPRPSLESFVNYEDNSFNVVRAVEVNNTAVLDGFIIRGGSAHAAGPPRGGGGLLCVGASPIIRNCTVTANAHGVPALHIAGNSEPRIFQCTFDSSHGRPVIIEGGAQPVFIDCTINGEFCNVRTAGDFGPPTSPASSAAAVP